MKTWQENTKQFEYVVLSSTLKGAQYGNIAQQLEEHASQELAHALEVAKQIDYLGGDPTIKSEDYHSIPRIQRQCLK